MSKRNQAFRLSKQTKRFMATIVDPLARNAYKNAMIDAQIASETLPPKSDKKKRNEAQVN
jgi:hypothetical protein